MRDREYLAWIHDQPCLVSGKLPVHAHHVRRFGERATDRRAVPLAPEFHLWDGKESVHRLGRRAFERVHGVNFEEEIVRLNREWESRRG